MAQFKNFSDYQKRTEARAARQSSNTSSENNFARVGFFGKDAAGNKHMTGVGDVAIARINIKSLEDFMFASYHQLDAAQKYMKIACLDDNCPLCAAAKAQADSGKAQTISRAKDRVLVPMVVAYKNADGTFTAPEPVIFDLPAAGRNDYAKILINKLNDYGPLTEHVFKITRNGIKLDTTYTFDCVPLFDNENVITKASLAAFDNFKIEKHSYWVKSREEVNAFLTTGAFPEVARTEAPQQAAQPTFQTQPAQPVYTAPTQPAYNAAAAATNTFAAAEANPFAAQPAQQQAAPTQPAASTSFTNFSF